MSTLELSTTTPDDRAAQSAVGVFFDASKLKDTVEHLRMVGVDRLDLDLLSGSCPARPQSADVDSQPRMPPTGPHAASIARHAGTETARAIFGGIAFCGATALGGTATALAGAVGGALAPAVASVLAVGLAGLVFATVVRESDAERLEEEVEKGHFVLLARAGDRARRQAVDQILRQHAAYDVHAFPSNSASDHGRRRAVFEAASMARSQPGAPRTPWTGC